MSNQPTATMPRLFGPDMLDNPYPVYRTLRETDPVHWDAGLGAWVLTRADDVSHVLKDNTGFSSDRVSPVRGRYADMGLEPVFDTLSLLMLQRDEPDHRRIRNLVHGAFSRIAIDRYAPRIAERVDALINAGIDQGGMDFVWDFSVPLPILVISEIVGIPEDDREQVKRWCDDFSVVALNFYANITREQLEAGKTSILAFKAYLSEKADRLRREPQYDLLSALIHAQDDDGQLSLEELLANCLLLLNAGNETTTCLLSNGLAALLRHPEQFQRLRETPSLLPHAIEEFLRFDSPVQFLARIATEDTTIRGTRIGKGDLVFVVIGAAGRDPDHFPDPDRFDIERAPNHHFAFGDGCHFCVGSQLAKLEARTAFTRLLERTSRIELVDQELQRRDNFNMRCYANLPIRLTT